ncbi:uncharacterized protein LOC116804340 [Drosophila mojavensis]|nr:uncharacterized protein LOC116804340 [Drosophila mojavensis]
MHLTLIDGKVLNIVTGTNSCQSCPLCGAKPKQLLEIADFNSACFKVTEKNLKYGLSPLHAWIRFLEFVLRISYKNDLKKWRIKEADKNQVAARKQQIQEKLWLEMGLIVDKPKQNGSGSSNDGNTARRAFSDPRKFSDILNLNYEVIRNFHIILIAISSEHYINSDKFRAFCVRTFEIYMNNYSWYPMSPTVHKVLIHGYQIMDSCIVPVGVLGENASEARNKIYKNDRRSHARKSSRLNNITDVFHRALDSSDPLLSSLCLKKRQKLHKKLKFPSEVIDLFALIEPPQIAHQFTNETESLEAEDEDEDDANNFDPNIELDEENYDY